MERVRNLLFTAAACILFTGMPIFSQEKEPLTETGAKDVIVNTDTEKDDKETGKSVATIKELVVTATKTEISKEETGASISIISGRDMEKSGKKNIAEVLRGIPGMTIVKSSPLGGTAQVSIRGSHQKNVLVLVDGVKVNDPSSIDRDFDFAHLTPDNIDRIEIIRGPASVIYGSDASAGVINIITRKGEKTPEIMLSLEAGSYKTFRESASIIGGNDRVDYSISLSRIDSKGISKAARAAGASDDPEKDSYANTTLSSRAGIKTFDNSRVDFSLRYTGTITDIDDDAYQDDPDRKYYNNVFSSSLNFRHEPFSFWGYKLSLSQASTLRKDNDTDDASHFINTWFEGKNSKVELQNNFMISDIDVITAGVSVEEDSASSINYADYGFGETTTELLEKRVSNCGYYIQNHLKLMKKLFFIAGLRLDDHQTYGQDFNYNLSLSWIFPATGTRLKGNYATGFKAPSIYQLYADTYGNPDLEPEENRSYDFGIEQTLFSGRVVAEALYFRNIYRNMIGFTSNYINIGRAETRGLECSTSVKIGDSLDIAAAYDYTWTQDRVTKEKLVRRPEHKGSLNMNWAFMNRGYLGITLLYVGERNDVYFDEFFTRHDVTLDPYFRVDLSAGYDVYRGALLVFRIENLTDADYEEVAGYQTPGITFSGGIKLRI